MGNAIVLQSFYGPQTVSTYPYDGNWYKTNGTYTITGLQPGGYYHIWMGWSTDGYYSGGVNSQYRKVQTPYTTTESLTRRDGTYVLPILRLMIRIMRQHLILIDG